MCDKSASGGEENLSKSLNNESDNSVLKSMDKSNIFRSLEKQHEKRLRRIYLFRQEVFRLLLRR